jgi:ATP-dependent DNA helicase PIF1
MEEKNYDKAPLRRTHTSMVNALNAEQISIYESVMSSNNTNSQILQFIYGHGGTRKTFVWTTIISALRLVGKIVLTGSGSGIASLLLPAGRTTHSMFNIPLEIIDNPLCFIKKKKLSLLSFCLRLLLSFGMRLQ